MRNPGDINDGTCCAICEKYFENPIQEDEDEIAGYSHGYPVVCVECWTKDCKYKVAVVDVFLPR